MTHYLADWKSKDYNLEMNVDAWNKLIDNEEASYSAIENDGPLLYMHTTQGTASGYASAPRGRGRPCRRGR